MVPYIEEYLGRDSEDPITIRDRESFLNRLKDSVMSGEITETERVHIIQSLGKLPEEAQVYRAFTWFSERNRRGWDSLNLTLLDLDAIIVARQFCVEYSEWYSTAEFDYSTTKTDKLLIKYMRNYITALGEGRDGWAEFSKFKQALLLGTKFLCFSRKVSEAAQKIFVPKERKYLTLLQASSENLGNSSSFGHEDDVSELILDYQMKTLDVFFNSPSEKLPETYSGYVEEIIKMQTTRTKVRVLDAIQNYYIMLLEKGVSESSLVSNFVLAKKENNFDALLLFPERSWDSTDAQCRWFVSVFTKEFFVKEMIHQKLRIDTTFLSSDDRKPHRDNFFPTLDLLHRYRVITKEEYIRYKQEGAKFL